MLRVIDPLPLGELKAPFDHPDWLFELKHDGYRCLVFIARGQPTRFVSRHGKTFRGLDALGASIAASLPLDNAVLDGELVCLDEDGKSIFNTLHRRRAKPIFYAFDLLWVSGRDCRNDPLRARKSSLQALLPMGGEQIIVADHVVGRGVDLFNAVCAKDCEGIVAKLADSPYALLRGKKSPWQKIKNAAYTQAVGRQEQFERYRR